MVREHKLQNNVNFDIENKMLLGMVCMPIFPEVGRLRMEDYHKFDTTFSYIASPRGVWIT